MAKYKVEFDGCQWKIWKIDLFHWFRYIFDAPFDATVLDWSIKETVNKLRENGDIVIFDEDDSIK